MPLQWMLPRFWVASTKRCNGARAFGAHESARIGNTGATEDAAARRAIAGQKHGGHSLEGHSYAEMRFCQAVRYFWLFSALLSNRCTLSSVCFDGKMSWLLATEGSYLSAACFAPATGGM